MMSLNRYMVKFFYLAVFSCVLVTAFLVGCGGGNNPSGPTATTTTPGTITSTTGTTPAISSTTVNLTGTLSNAFTDGQIEDATAHITVKASLLGTAQVYTYDALAGAQNKAFAFLGLPEGLYRIDVTDANGKFLSEIFFQEVVGANTNLNLRLSPATVGTITSKNYYGFVKDAAYEKGIQFVTIRVRNNSGSTFETTTLINGFFLMRGLASGTYEISFEKTGFETASRTLVIKDDVESRFGTTQISPITSSVDISTAALSNGLYTGNAVDLKQTVYLAPALLGTGGLSGILKENGVLVPDTTNLDLIYDLNTQDEIPPAVIIESFNLKNSYFLAKNLPAGFYMVGKSPQNWFPKPIFDGNGNIKGYNLVDLTAYNADPNTTTPADLVSRVWLEVKVGTVTPIPEEE